MAYITLRPQVCLALGLYIKPTELESVLHMIKPTVMFSPTGLIFANVTLSPSSTLRKTTTSVSVTLKKEFRFGSLQFYLYRKTFNERAEADLTPTEHQRQLISLPIRPTPNLDMFYDNGTLMSSATVFETQRELQISIPTSSHIATPTYKPPLLLPSAYTVAALLLGSAYLGLVISKAYQRFQKGLILIIGLGVLIIGLGVLIAFRIRYLGLF